MQKKQPQLFGGIFWWIQYAEAGSSHRKKYSTNRTEKQKSIQIQLMKIFSVMIEHAISTTTRTTRRHFVWKNDDASMLTLSDQYVQLNVICSLQL